MTTPAAPFEWPQIQSWHTGEMVDRWDEFDSDCRQVFAKCPVCKALLDSWDQDAHKAWHVARGG